MIKTIRLCVSLLVLLTDCAMSPKVEFPEHTPNVVIREYKMALRDLMRKYPNHNWSLAQTDVILRSTAVIKKIGVFDCFGRRVHGCYVPMINAIFYRQKFPIVLRHEWYHAIQWWCQHPNYGKEEPYKSLHIGKHLFIANDRSPSLFP